MSTKRNIAILGIVLGASALSPRAAHADLAGSICTQLKGTIDTLMAKGKTACVGKDEDWVENSKFASVCTVYDGALAAPKNKRKIAQPPCGYFSEGTIKGTKRVVTSDSAIEALLEFKGFSFNVNFQDKWDCSVNDGATCEFNQSATDPKQKPTAPGPAPALNYISAMVSTDGNFLSKYVIGIEFAPVGKDGKKQDEAAWKTFFTAIAGAKLEVSLTCGNTWKGAQYIAGDSTPALDAMCK